MIKFLVSMLMVGLFVLPTAAPAEAVPGPCVSSAEFREIVVGETTKYRTHHIFNTPGRYTYRGYQSHYDGPETDASKVDPEDITYTFDEQRVYRRCGGGRFFVNYFKAGENEPWVVFWKKRVKGYKVPFIHVLPPNYT